MSTAEKRTKMDTEGARGIAPPEDLGWSADDFNMEVVVVPGSTDQQNSAHVDLAFHQHETEKAPDLTSPKDDVTLSNGIAGDHDNDGNTMTSCCYALFAWLAPLKAALRHHRPFVGRWGSRLFFVLYVLYSGFALYRQWGTEAATRLLLLLVIVLWVSLGRRVSLQLLKRLGPVVTLQPEKGRTLRTVVRWILYVVAAGGGVAYLALEIAPKKPSNLLTLGGIALLLLVGLLLSTHPHRVNWHTVFWALAIQFYLAVFLIRTQQGKDLFQWLGGLMEKFISYTDIGSKFLFGDAYTMHPMVFQMLPVILFLNCVIAVGYQLGIIQALIATLGRFLSFCLDTTPIESVNAAANVFLGLAVAPLLVKPFLKDVTESELFAIMTGGFASIAGAIMGALVAIGIPSNHILAASVMSAPAALGVAKIMCPETEGDNSSTTKDAYKVNLGTSTNLLEAVSQAAVMGVSIMVTVSANLFIFMIFLTFADNVFEWFGEQVGIHDFPFTRLLSYVFYPLMYLCGVDAADLLTLGRLVSVKLLTSTIFSYQQVAALIDNSATLSNYTKATNGSWHYQGDDLVLHDWNVTLTGGVLTERSVVMSTYILCGFSSISSIGICIGSMTSIAPSRTKHILKHVVMAGVAGNIACFLTGCVAGLLYI
ncbi:uncharacterized transporter HI_0519-like isoform X1 [Littorina saxatilis]|uniref:Sodium/nucleoside cotransporter n=1 Tax=Littorina saxatilis TaxID=31220 RepID=A0AAN9GE37_9CAEN